MNKIVKNILVKPFSKYYLFDKIFKINAFYLGVKGKFLSNFISIIYACQSKHTNLVSYLS